ncbi:hypothetical protein [Ferruginibacter albus]|uniref:hypothetical protein n=1 Tax=Ferruginibacter albus TaxID=2875540 RepID=UPI001CC5200D|nr:hypothetical protein [Ferruginibacter albus]UAY51392.1 hypothetical protein K9M53_12435 [Ferruginibacter albus]
MNFELTQISSTEEKNEHNLHRLVSKILQSYLPIATDKKTLLVNDIDEKIVANINGTHLSGVIDSIINMLIINSENNCIWLTAKRFHDVVLIHAKNNKPFDVYLNKREIEKLQDIAQKAGGCISINVHTIGNTTIVFSFVNLAVAA